MSKSSQISNLRGLWQRIKAKMTSADTATLNAAKAYADTKFGQIETFQQEVVQELPAQGAAKTLYFVPSTNAGQDNIYDEFVWVASKNNGAGGYEQVGSTAYTPDHSVENNSNLNKLVVTIGGTKYVIPREVVITPQTPQLKDDSTVVDDGDDFTNTKSLTLACATEGAEIYYIKSTGTASSPVGDGNVPASGATKYTSAISFAQDTSKEYETYNIKAAAFLNGAVSDVLDISVKIYRQVAKPTFGVAAGTYGATQSVSLSCSTTGATIRYAKAEGSTPSDPDSTSTAYESAISVTKSTVIKAYASLEGWRHSEVATASYELAVSTPTISAAGDQYDTSRVVTISKPSNADSYKYKKSGDSGYTTGTGDSATLTLNATATVEAVGEKTGWTAGNASLSVTVGTLFTHAGLSSASAASNVSLSELTVLDSGNAKKPNPAGTYDFSNNSGATKYIWFAVPSNKTINSVLAGAVPQDVEAPQTIGSYKFYRMTGAILTGKSISLTVA